MDPRGVEPLSEMGSLHGSYSFRADRSRYYTTYFIGKERKPTTPFGYSLLLRFGDCDLGSCFKAPRRAQKVVGQAMLDLTFSVYWLFNAILTNPLFSLAD